MSTLDKKIKEFEKDPDCEDDDDFRSIPLDDDVKKYIIDMVCEFDFSEDNNSIDRDSTVVDSFYINVYDDVVEAYINVNIQGARYSYSHYYAGDYWNPPEWDVDEDPYNEWFEFYAGQLNQEMTLREVIDEICKQTWNCDGAVRELREITKDPDNEPPEDW